MGLKQHTAERAHEGQGPNLTRLALLKAGLAGQAIRFDLFQERVQDRERLGRAGCFYS